MIVTLRIIYCLLDLYQFTGSVIYTFSCAVCYEVYDLCSYEYIPWSVQVDVLFICGFPNPYFIRLWAQRRLLE